MLVEKEVHKMTIVVKKVPKAFRGIVKFLFRIKERFRNGDGSFLKKEPSPFQNFYTTYNNIQRKCNKLPAKMHK